ncbi:MAG: hypothetical protein AB8B74_13190 [Crocinitomicaceae bacterium]
MKRKTIKIITLVLCLIAFNNANAQSRLKKQVKLFNTIDTNCDQRISAKEYNRYRMQTRTVHEKQLRKRNFSRSFFKMDSNRNGFIGKREFVTGKVSSCR